MQYRSPSACVRCLTDLSLKSITAALWQIENTLVLSMPRIERKVNKNFVCECADLYVYICVGLWASVALPLGPLQPIYMPRVNDVFHVSSRKWKLCVIKNGWLLGSRTAGQRPIWQIAHILSKDTLRWPNSKNHISRFQRIFIFQKFAKIWKRGQSAVFRVIKWPK